MAPPFDQSTDVPPDVTVRTAALAEGLMGLWDEDERTVWLDARLTPAERRCTLAHELVHAERGDLPCEDPVLDTRQEQRVEREAARRLVPLERLLDALRWTSDAAEAADVLDVDPALLRTRLEALSRAERRTVERSIAQAAP
jgi:Zn-dependent peptidase ImmA (M78 family)